MKTKSAFSVLEVLIALSILSITLMAVYQSFASSLFVLQSTKTLWKAMAETQKELLRWNVQKHLHPCQYHRAVLKRIWDFWMVVGSLI
ncbi:MAG: type II secretion system protein J [bacterium]